MVAGTIAQKILGSHSDVEQPDPGMHLKAEPDWVIAHDISCYPGIERMRQLGFDRVERPESVIVAIDHYVPSSSDVISDQQNEIEEWVADQGIEHYFRAGTGISHNVIAERGYPAPGSLVLGADSHTTTHGAFGAFATGIGHTDLGDVFGTGELWLRVPESRKVIVDGPLADGASAKDLALKLMGELTAKGAIYESVEYHGTGIEALEMHERQTLSNLAVELGAMAGIVPADEVTHEYLSGRRRSPSTVDPVHPDPDAEYVETHRIDVTDLVPLVAKPSKVDNVDTVSNVAGTAVDQVFVGTCNNGRWPDIEAFAGVLNGESVAPGTDLIVVPGSRDTLKKMNASGVSNAIVDAGGMIGTPGCGPCFGAHGGILGEGDTCLGTMNRNFPGRMGPGEIYIGSPQTAAAAAIYGEITDPREVA